MIEALEQYLYEKLLPLITGRFLAGDGLFHERLIPDLEPDRTANRRLTAQCRQVFVVSLLARNNQDILLAADVFDRVQQLFYRGPEDGWIFSIDPSSRPACEDRDLYAHAFTILACAGLLHRTEKVRYHALARETLSFLDARFGHPAGGFFEALDGRLSPIERTRRQNPHMHLFEACVAMYEFSNDRKFLARADDILNLLTSKFLDETSVLREYFDRDLNFCKERGHIAEPGHHFEWAFLLHERIRVDKQISKKKAGDLRALAYELTERAAALGWDKVRGGIYDEVTPAGEILASSKRIWPLMEAIKAAALHAGEHLPSLDELIHFAFSHYLHAESGVWTEQLDADLRPARTELPGTTPYHVAVSLITLLRALRPQDRGSSNPPH